MQRRFPQIGVSVVFIIGSFVLFVHFTRIYGRLCLLLSSFSLWVLASSNK